jgi:hypothetical protein
VLRAVRSRSFLKGYKLKRFCAEVAVERAVVFSDRKLFASVPPSSVLPLVMSFTASRYTVPNVPRTRTQTGCMKIEGVDDAAEFRDVLTAMNTLQFSSSTVESMLKAIAGILLLGTLSDAADVCCCGVCRLCESVGIYVWVYVSLRCVSKCSRLSPAPCCSVGTVC